MAESLFRNFEIFRSFKDILQCIMTRAIWQRQFSTVQFIISHHLFIRLILILFFIKFT
jgi:hypothetical protein